MNDAPPILAEIAKLLGRYGYEERASFIGRLIDLNASEDFWPAVAGLEFWGGSGAVWEVEPFHMSHSDIGTSADDYRRFQALMVDLADILELKGMSALAARTASLFRRQLEDR